MAKARSKRITFSVTPEIYDEIIAAAEYAGVSVNAWIAVKVGGTARLENAARNQMMAQGLAVVSQAMAEAAQMEIGDSEEGDDGTA